MELQQSDPSQSTRQSREFIGSLSTKGVVTIPAEVRKFLQVKPHDKVLFRIQGDRVEIESGPMTLEEACGSVAPLDPPKSIAQIRSEVREDRAKKVTAKLNA